MGPVGRKSSFLCSYFGWGAQSWGLGIAGTLPVLGWGDGRPSCAYTCAEWTWPLKPCLSPHPCPTEMFLSDFLLTHSVFMPSAQLCSALLHQYPSGPRVTGTACTVGRRNRS